MLIKCKECGVEISGFATVCPKCGCPGIQAVEVTATLKNPVATGVLLGIGFFIILMTVVSAFFIAIAIVT